MPPSIVCTSAVTTDAERHAANRLVGEHHGDFSPLLARQALPESLDRRRRRLAAGIQHRREDHDQQELDQHETDVAQLRQQPATGFGGVGLDLLQQRLRPGIGQLRPQVVHFPAQQRQSCHPVRRLRQAGCWPTCWTRVANSPAWPTMISTASSRGMNSSSSMASVITATAGARRPRKRCSSPVSIGQVATTIMAAHTSAPRKGAQDPERTADQQQQAEDGQGGTGQVASDIGHAGSRWILEKRMLPEGCAGGRFRAVAATGGETSGR
jgi:hypothetical protein